MDDPGTSSGSRTLDRFLREVVLRHGRSESRRCYPPTLHAGLPGGDLDTVRRLTLPVPTPDPAERLELVEALVGADRRHDRVPVVWLTRPFGHREDDLGWAVAARTAGAELGVALRLFGVSKRSWHDPWTGASRVWERPIRVRGASGHQV